MKAYKLETNGKNVCVFDVRCCDKTLFIGRNGDELVVAQNTDGELNIEHFELGDCNAMFRTFKIADLDERAHIGALLVLLADERICNNALVITSIFNA